MIFEALAGTTAETNRRPMDKVERQRSGMHTLSHLAKGKAKSVKTAESKRS